MGQFLLIGTSCVQRFLSQNRIDHKIFKLLGDIVNEQKFELTDEIKIVIGRTLHRIRALKDFRTIHAGELGGWIEKEENLSQEESCWVYDNACVFENAYICDNAIIRDNAKVYGNSMIFDNVVVHDDSKVCGSSKCYGNSVICNNSIICGDARVYGKAVISGDSFIKKQEII